MSPAKPMVYNFSRFLIVGASRERTLLPTIDHPRTGLPHIWSVYTGWHACFKLSSPLPTDRRQRERETGKSRLDNPVIRVSPTCVVHFWGAGMAQW